MDFNKTVQRKCPECGQHAIDVSILEHEGYTHCSYCRAKVEKWFSFSVFISIILGGGALLSFNHGVAEFGFPLAILSFLYSIFYSKVNSRLLPLKSY